MKWTMSRRLVMALVLVAGLLAPWAPARAQESSGDGPVSPDSADAIRAGLDRPPHKPPFDFVDGVTLPFRILVWPLRIVGYGFAELIGAVTQEEAQEVPPIFRWMKDRGFQPAFGSIGPRSGIAAELTYVGAKPLVLDAAFSIRTSQRYMVGLQFEDYLGSLYAGYTFQRDAEPHFWGVGPDSRKEDRVDYLRDHQRVSVSGMSRVSTVRLYGELTWEDNRVDRGKDGRTQNIQDHPEFSTLYGVDERVRYVLAVASAGLDLTRNLGFQQRGVYLELGSGIYRGIDGTDSDFHRFNLVVRGYVPLNPRQQLAFQIISELNRVDRGEEVPFYHLAILGDNFGARALNQERFRDNDMAALMTEWRYEVWRELQGRSRVETFFLFDTGSVQSDVTRISLSDMKRSFGFGWRLVAQSRANVVNYLAFGPEGLRFRISFSAVF